jgi:hypothetical protein
VIAAEPLSFMTWNPKDNTHSCKTVRKLIKNIAKILPEISEKIVENNTVGPRYYFEADIISMPGIQRFNEQKEKYQYLRQLLKNKFGFCTNELLACHAILHEYRHSKQKHWTYGTEDKICSILPNDNIGEVLYRYLPSEFDADRWAIRFIKKHWITLFPYIKTKWTHNPY